MGDSHNPKDQASAETGYLRRILSNASWLTGSQFAGDVANLVLFVILARAYGPEGIGQYAYALGIAAIAYSIINLGLEDYAVRECARTSPARRGLLIGRLLAIQVSALLIVSVALYAYVAWVDHSGQAIALIIILVAQQAFFAFSRTLLSPAYAEQKMIPASIAQFVTRLFGIVAALVLVIVFDWGLAYSLIPLAVGGLFLFLYSLGSCRSECLALSIRFEWQPIKDTLREVWPFAGSLALSLLAIRSSFIIINLLLDDAATGLYASAMKLMEVAVLPLNFLGLAAYPRLSSLYHSSQEEFYVAGEVLVRVATMLGIIISWGLLFVAPYVIEPLLGETFTKAAPIVQSLAGLALLTSISFMVVRLMLAADQHRLRLAIQAFMVTVLLVTTFIAIPLMGLNGAIVGMYASVTTAVALTIAMLGKEFRRKALKPLFLMGLSAALALLGSYLVTLAFKSIVLPAVLSICVFIVASSVFGLIPRSAIPIFRRSSTSDSQLRQ
jgi:O-antigen/teichoic acid export membrane protein